MGDCSDVQALEKISSEVDESRVKITLSNHCIKAQGFLVNKLRKQSERQKEVCSFIYSSNVKLEGEIKQAEQEIQSLRSAYDAIRAANVELRKELLLAKESKIEVEEHVRVGEKKYEDLWLECKRRYESIPYMKKLLQTTETAHMLGDDIIALQNEVQNLVKNIDTKKAQLMNLDRQRIVEMANYIVNEMPITINVIKEKSSEIKKITLEIEEIAKEGNSKEPEKIIVPSVEVNEVAPPSVDLNISTEDSWPNLYSNDNEPLPIPKLRLVGTDFDALSAKLDQIKTKKVEILQTNPVKRTDSVLVEDETTIHKKPKKFEENTPYYFSKLASIEKSNNDIEAKCNFSNRKLINILENIKLDKNDTYKLVSKVNLENLKDIDAIGIDASTVDDKEATPMESEQIEEIDLTGTNSGNIVVPPTQFMDYTQETSIRTSLQVMAEPEDKYNHNSFKNSQENVKKRVSFDLPSSVQITSVDDDGDNDDEVQNVEAETNKTANSELDMSGVSDDGYKKIRDMILKKHNLNLSPQFVYAKIKSTKMRNEENVTSKFFQQFKASDLDVLNSEAPPLDEMNVNNKIEDIEMQTEKAENVVEKVENIVASGTKIQSHKVQKSVSGFLFKHGTQEIPDSLNVSMSTTGFDDGEGDFPHCLDSSLLLSPKADIPMPMSGEKAEVLSQEVPNFLSGLRKTGLSFFGLSSAQETNPDNNAENTTNNFNFNFGGDDKKNRGGLFSMFR